MKEAFESIAGIDINDPNETKYKFPTSTEYETLPKKYLVIAKEYMDAYTSGKELRNSILKRGIDISISLVVVIFILPLLFIFFGILIKLESRGPILFKQIRSGP
jgi:lipopolysaccharide/colanic/teichoic acid biosynthesis glycosyltransferase